MRKTIWLISMIFLLNIAFALPPIAQEFYGMVLLSGSPAPMLTGVKANYNSNLTNTTLCGSFTVVDPGKYGLLTCMGDDPETSAEEGALENQNITFTITTFNASYKNGTNATTWSGNITDLDFFPVTLSATANGDTSWNSGEFHQVNLYATFEMWWLLTQNVTTNETNVTLPSGFCGDALCGVGEDCGICPLDCGICPPPPPGKGGGGGDQGASGEKKESSSKASTAPAEMAEQLVCFENWQCAAYSKCQPDEKKTRTCEDTSKCGSEVNKPATTDDCCYEKWECADWSECSLLGVQERMCLDKNTCNTTDYAPNTTRECKYPTCNDGQKNGDETGVDCGGQCPECKGVEFSKPVVMKPAYIAQCGDNICNINEPCSCEKDCRKFPWFIILIAIAVSLAEHAYNKMRIKRIRDDIYVRKMERLKKIAKIRRNTMWFKTITIIASTILSIYIYYFATCPGGFRRFLGVLIAGAVLTPIIAYSILKRFEYSEEERELRYDLLLETHKEQLENLIKMENVEIKKVEEQLIANIKGLNIQGIQGMDAALKLRLDSIAYKLGLLSKFLKDNQDYVDAESQLCNDLEKLREDEPYKKMCENNDFKPIDSTLLILLTHHKDKQELIKNMLQEEERQRAEEEKIDGPVKEQIIKAKEELKQASSTPEIQLKNDAKVPDEEKVEEAINIKRT